MIASPVIGIFVDRPFDCIVHRRDESTTTVYLYINQTTHRRLHLNYAVGVRLPNGHRTHGDMAPNIDTECRQRGLSGCAQLEVSLTLAPLTLLQ